MSRIEVNNRQFGKEGSRIVLTDNARTVLTSRYLKKDAEGKTIETPEELFDRVARHVAQVEEIFDDDPGAVQHWYDRFYHLMASLKFLPNSPTLMNTGRSMGMLSACFVLPVPDSIDGIFDAVKHTALIQKAGGGTGFSFDRLRPTGDHISSSGGKTSGPISFWRVLSETTNAIQQGAFRRGANMGMMSLSHPDILKFLHAKQDLQAFTNYNISVKITDAWMEQLFASPDSLHLVRNPRTGKLYYLPRSLDIWGYDINDLVAVPEGQNREAGFWSDPKNLPHPLRPEEFWTVGQIWELIVTHAHQTGEPGLAFIDRINRDNPTPQLGAMEATNPCGEQPLLPYEACNLGSINLAKFVDNQPDEQGAVRAAATGIEALGRIQWAALQETIHESVRFLDDVIEINNYQIEPIDQICKANRKIGLGVMGFADCLYKLGIPYDSEEAVAVGGELMRFLNEQGHQMSETLARQRGAFANWKNSRWDSEKHRLQRNATVTTVAPTGTLSIIADCSGGIEPMFSLVFIRNVLGGKKLLEVNPTFKAMAQERGFYSEALLEAIAQSGSIAERPEIPSDIKRIFVCAHDIAPEWHVRMQAAFQQHCDASISKTINFPHQARPEQVDEIYRLAYRLQCKGVTVYRDGCRVGQPMSTRGPKGKVTSPAQAAVNGLGLPVKPLTPITLPEIMTCIRVRQLTPFGNMHVKITVDPHTERELEVFAQLGKGGDLANSDLEAICRMLSLLLRCGGSLDLAIKQLDGIGSSLTIPAREGRIMSLADGLAKAMAKYRQAKEKNGLKALILGKEDIAFEQNHDTNDNRRNDDIARRMWDGYKIKCPACGMDLAFVEGCVKCFHCGFSQC